MQPQRSSRASIFLSAWALALLTGAATACVAEAEPEAAPEDGALLAALGAKHRAALLVPGKDIVVLGVTDSGHALYWQAGAVFATALRPGAPRTRIADAPSPPATLVANDVAMIWTAQSMVALPAPSPLVVWTPWRGARRAAESSWPPLSFSIHAGSAVSPRGDAVLFSDGVSEDGSTGQLVWASADLSRREALILGVQVNPFGACPPHLGFDRLARGAFPWTPSPRPLALACSDGASAATLVRGIGARRSELSSELAPGSWWTVDRAGRSILARRGDGASVVFDASGAMTVVEARRSLGWMTDDGEVITRVLKAPGVIELQRSVLTPTLRTEPLVELGPATGVMFANHLPSGASHYDRTAVPTSPDGSFYGGFGALDPNTGLTDVYLVSLEAGRAPVQLHAEPNAIPGAEIATRDSTHLLYYTYDADSNSLALHVGDEAGATRQLSSGNAPQTHYGLEGSAIAFADNAASTAALGTIDIRLVDVAEDQAPSTLVSGAHPGFFPTKSRRFLVYSTEQGAAGLWITRVPH